MVSEPLMQRMPLRSVRLPDIQAIAADQILCIQRPRRRCVGLHGVIEALYLRDPDGNGLELYCDRPRDQWPTAGEDGSIAIFTAPLDLQSLLAEA